MIKHFNVPTEDLPNVRKIIKDSSDREIRRFVIDGHNGKEYWHNEINVAEKPELGKMKECELIPYIIETSRKDGYQIYAIVEVKGNDSIEELNKLPPNVIADIMRPIYYNFFDEPLESFRNMI